MVIDDVGVEEVDEVSVVEILHDLDLVEDELLLRLAGQVDLLDRHAVSRQLVQRRVHRPRSAKVQIVLFYWGAREKIWHRKLFG